MLAYDERMTLHAEGKWSSHPERPDRVRAVMARLAASGLTGWPAYSLLSPPPLQSYSTTIIAVSASAHL